MVKTISSMLPLGTPAPQFSLTDVVTASTISLNQKQDCSALVIMFICNHCPYVKHVSHELTKLASDYISKGVHFIAINANDIETYPDDSPENMKRVAEKLKFPFPYLYDSTQEVTRAYQATCTPDFFVFDKNKLLCYRGQLDDSRPGNNIPVSGNSIREALDKILSGATVSTIQKPSMGCNIKWKI